MNINVLYYIYGLNIGGAETFVQNILEKINFNKYKIEFVLQISFVHNKRIKEILDENKIKVYHITSYYKDPLKSTVELKKILENGRYDIIHIHINSLLNIMPMILAEKYNVKIVLHSHNSNNTKGGKIGKILHYFNKQLITRYKTVNLACSDEAGKWMFRYSDYQIIYNGIDIDKYRYNSEARAFIRNKYGVNEGEYLIGHVGRLAEQKNHRFFIKCVSEILNKKILVKAIFVGDGTMKEEIVSVIKKYGLGNNIFFAGEVENTYDYYSAFDLMLFPSIWEGLPFAMVEAQASGIPIVASDVITKQVNITGLVTYLDLKSSVKEWNTVIVDKLKSNIDRVFYNDEVRNSVFNIDDTVMRIEEIYERNCQKK